ncbi:Diacylglycerol acyltransferase/mycolyltransferase Ag85C precursor [Corynebacterium urogenitale]|uniref:Diacylglycerol acyltransferase/mycolyltransferase Ag85C n=1 Tax=Corynebacterium urogenitale TaxID=2487892 RepID=A0A5J6Z5F9_9CORY|nr:alpha/beta hydrolase-fold protein [Corynebacterium urogenitale]QFQ01601.1 Diacylglycerol acyltransferase/mycolyltransferase Ag85C precursor [Corynebacterium urogenitale]
MRIAAILPRRIKPAILALPVAATLALPLIPVTANQTVVPAAEAQSSLGGSLGPGSSTDYLDPDSIPERTPVETEVRDIEGLPDGVEELRVEWITARWANVYIKSAAMPDQEMKVQILLARDWYTHPEKTFPEVWALDGLRARDDESGWTLETNIANFYADKNVNVILPVGGESSFYTDWQQPENGKHYKWESFLIKELPYVLKQGWRSNGERAVTGLSMGGTAAMNLATRYPDMFKFAGSFSGYLDTTSFGMPEGIAYATNDGGGYDATKMWGPFGSQDWIDHDPKLGVANLKGKSVYVSAGNGNTGKYDKDSALPGVPTNTAGMGLEVMSRMTSETFVKYAKKAGVDVVTKFRPSGTHSWPYWQFEMTEAWPYIADALKVPEEDRGTQCEIVGEIAANISKAPDLGACISNEYDGPASKTGAKKPGKIQDFRGGQAFWSPATGAHYTWGRIGALYAGMGGPGSWLGYPKSEEIAIKDGGRFVAFEGGNIYWHPSTGAVAVKSDIVEEYGKGGWENGPLGYPIEAAQQVEGKGAYQKFQNGVIYRNANGDTQYVQGLISQRYFEIGHLNSPLGFPKTDELNTPRGAKRTEFENGIIYWSPQTGAHEIYYGEIFDAWAKTGYEGGKWGFPVEAQKNIPAGGISQKFEKGTVTVTNGQVKFTPNA